MSLYGTANLTVFINSNIGEPQTKLITYNQTFSQLTIQTSFTTLMVNRCHTNTIFMIVIYFLENHVLLNKFYKTLMITLSIDVLHL